jgi:hypothetical protein
MPCRPRSLQIIHNSHHIVACYVRHLQGRDPVRGQLRFNGHGKAFGVECPAIVNNLDPFFCNDLGRVFVELLQEAAFIAFVGETLSLQRKPS